ncbi:MAG: DNA-3-methyladenine glycosylase 2 family protein [Verrucomicrobia bacterium]|nr:DNA-3-methyladenine glycosylase 2 family protein [Verrucomicrobiota bacterium]
MHRAAELHLSKSDRVLARVIRDVGPCMLRPRRNCQPFQSLVQAVTHQQLNGTAAQAILKRFIALFPGSKFPQPGDIIAASDERLRSAGLSRAKTAAIKDIARNTSTGHVPTRREAARLTDEDLVARLTEIRGVGPWTVEMFLIFTLGRRDVLPVGDYGVRCGFAKAYRWKEMPTPKELLAEGECWRPYRSIAAWYLWRVLEAG